MIVGPCGGYLRSFRTDRRNRTTLALAVETAAKNSDSVELRAVTFCVLERNTTAPPASQIANPVVERRFRGSLPYAASVYAVSSVGS